MSHSSPRPTRFAAGAVLLSVFLITACTASTSNEDKGANSSPSPVSSSARTPAEPSEPSEKKLTEQAQATLVAVHDGTLVEAGAERVTDGIHTEPALGKGKTYKLNLVCVGSGSAQLKFVPASIGKETTVPCDRSVIQQRIVADKAVRIDVDGTEGSTGVIAWQIDAV